MQHEVTVIQPLLDEKGQLREPGWARRPVFTYNRGAIKAHALRIKEWDYYLILNDHHAIALTLADNSYMGMVSASILNFDTCAQHTESLITPFPRGKIGMPADADDGDVRFENNRAAVHFFAQNGTRKLSFSFKRFQNQETLSAEFLIAQPFEDRMVIATPWEKGPKAFYFNQKINCMPAAGFYELGGQRVNFDPEDTFATLDWGRGVWTHDNTWYWGSGNGWVDGLRFGFNFGYGFGDTSAASENLLLYDGVANKLGRVSFKPADPSDLMLPWQIVSEDQRVNLTFQPLFDRAAKMNAVFLSSDQHQVFGRASGKVILENGKPLTLQNLTCFFEKVRNVW